MNKESRALRWLPFLTAAATSVLVYDTCFPFEWYRSALTILSVITGAFGLYRVGKDRSWKTVLVVSLIFILSQRWLTTLILVLLLWRPRH